MKLSSRPKRRRVRAGHYHAEESSQQPTHVTCRQPTEMTVSLEVSEKELQELTRLATTYALAHGLLYLPVGDIQPPAPTSAIHAPLAIFPTSFPRSKFLLAQKLQPLYNVLCARVATDEKFLDGVMGAVEGVGKVDRFTGQLWNCWKQLRDEGIQQVRDKDFIEHLF